MDVDAVERLDITEKDIAFALPARILLVGVSGAGKSSFILNLLKNKARTLSKPVSMVWYCHPAEARAAGDIEYRNALAEAVPGIKFHVGIPDFSKISFYPSEKIVILDDMFTSLINNETFANVVTTVSRHSNTSLMITSQDVFQPGKWKTTITRNCTDIILFYSKGNKRTISNYSLELLPRNVNFLSNCMSWMELNIRNPRERYLVIDSNLESPISEAMQIRTRIFPLDYLPGSPIQPIYFSPKIIK